ncbi:MAG: hypothetical protein ACTSQ8_25610 [Candidatus Helarchaeota archaeon]
MRFLEKKAIRTIILVLMIILISASITGICLLRLPLFYEQSLNGKVMLFFFVGLVFFILIHFVNKTFIFPYAKQYHTKNNLVFIIPMILFLLIAFAISSANYWAMPEINRVELCFDAENRSNSLKIGKLVDPNTNRLYPPDTFGFTRYPIIIDSGSCVNGRVIVLVSRLTQALMGYRITVNVQEIPPAGRFYLSVNDVPAVVNLVEDANSQSENAIVLKEGFDKGILLSSPYRQYWFMGVKVLGIIICSTYISLFLFGFTEKIIYTQSKTTNKSNE